MPYFLKTTEIRGASKYPAFQQEIELLSFQKVSDTEVEIALSSGEFVAAMILYVYFGDQNLRISKAVLTTVVDIRLISVVSVHELTNVTVTKTHLSANGITFFTLSGNTVKFKRLRDPANGLPTGKRMHKPFAITAEIDKVFPSSADEIDVNNAGKLKIRGFYKK